MKILVYGASGTGKTLLSQRLSKDLLIDFYSIDDIFWKKNLQKFIMLFLLRIKLVVLLIPTIG